MKNSGKFALSPLLVAFLAAGCSSRYVIVTDDKGAPVSGAEVTPISLSINYAPEITDSQGRAPLHSEVQEIKWVTVTKNGYSPPSQIDIGQIGNPTTMMIPIDVGKTGNVTVVLKIKK